MEQQAAVALLSNLVYDNNDHSMEAVSEPSNGRVYLFHWHHLLVAAAATGSALADEQTEQN